MNNFWQDCLAQIKAMKLPPMIITNWFEPIELVRWDSERGDMVLEAPASKVQTIRATYLKTIQDVAVHLYGGQVKVTLQAVGALAGDVQTPAQPKGPSLEDIERRREETGLLPGLTFDLVRAEFSLSVNDPENVRLLIRHIQILLQHLLHDLPGAPGFVVLIAGDQPLAFDAERREQLHRHAGVLRQNHITFFQRFPRARRDFAKVPDGRAHHIQTGHFLFIPFPSSSTSGRTACRFR